MSGSFYAKNCLRCPFDVFFISYDLFPPIKFHTTNAYIYIPENGFIPPKNSLKTISASP